MSLRVQLVLLQAVIVCLATLITGVIAASLQERAIREAYRDRMSAVAQSVAGLPSIIEALNDDNPALVVQPIAEVVREASDLTYVVVTDDAGIRMSHPNTDRIGERVSTDPSIPLSGRIETTTQEGTLGLSWRVKVPIFAPGTDQVIGIVSVGILEEQLSTEFFSQVPWLLAAMGASAVIGVFGAAWVTAIVRRRIFRLEPAEIATLVEQRETMLHRIGEGIVTVDPDGIITIANDAAVRLLGSDDLVGKRAASALEEQLADILDRGEPDGVLVLVGERVLVARSTGAIVDGDRVAATLLIRDHTELHAALREMDGAQSLTDGLRAQAHEFANTMHVVSGLLELGETEEARAFIARTNPDAVMSDGAARPVLGEVELSALLAVKKSQARELGITLDVQDAQPQAPRIGESLGKDLVTILGNVIDNALEACAVGDTIVLNVEADDHRVRLVIEDTGPGIPPDRREQVFVEGISGHSSSDGPRRGIGLALVRRIIRRRGGQVTITDSATGGARFTIELPLTAPADADTFSGVAR